tara:strand:- start:1560 stop:1775 length:216 start_codon:yes stop_codon:yes gene_type:complete
MLFDREQEGVRYSKYPNMTHEVKMYRDDLFNSDEEFDQWLSNNVVWLDSFHEFYDWDSIGKLLYLKKENEV